MGFILLKYKMKIILTTTYLNSPSKYNNMSNLSPKTTSCINRE